MAARKVTPRLFPVIAFAPPLVRQFIKALYSPQVFCLLPLVYLYWKVPTKENLRQGFKH